MNYYLELADESGAFARWRMAAVLHAAAILRADALPQEATLLLASDPDADVVALAARYDGDDLAETRQLFASALAATSLAMPSFGEAWTLFLAIGARAVQKGDLDAHDLLLKEFEFLADYPAGVASAYLTIDEYLDCHTCHANYDGEEEIATLASFLDGRSIPEWLALLTDPSRDSPAFAEPVPEEKPGRRGRARSLAARAIRRIRGGRSA
jgi:hypothetical protein